MSWLGRMIVLACALGLNAQQGLALGPGEYGLVVRGSGGNRVAEVRLLEYQTESRPNAIVCSATPTLYYSDWERSQIRQYADQGYDIYLEENVGNSYVARCRHNAYGN